MRKVDKSSLNIMIVAKYDPTIDWVQLSLQEQNYQVIGQVQSVEQALQRMRQTHVDIILADASGEGVTDTKWIRKLALQPNGALVLVIATSMEMDFIREAMLAGAQSFLLKPFDLSELSHSIEQVHQLWLQRQALIAESVAEAAAGPLTKAYSFALFSPKGGTGVTTLAVNLAVALHQVSGKPVLLVDADIRAPDVDIFLNVFGKNSILDLIKLDQKIDTETLNSVAVSHISGISVLRGDSRLQLIDEPVEPGEMGTLIEELIPIWDGYIVVNTGNSLDRWTVEIMDAVDTVLLVTTPELPALRVMRGFLDLAEAETEPGDKWQLVMTRYQNQKVLRMTDIEASIHYPIKATIAADLELVPTSINRGNPLVISHNKSAIAQDILSLARQLTHLNPDSEKAPSTPPTTGQTKPSGKRAFFWQILPRPASPVKNSSGV